MVYLVGAGPGDPGLITCYGKELLNRCEVLIYDHLGTSELLGLVPQTCIKQYVGKIAGAHSQKQEEINRMLVDAAKNYHTVVRLKGGDPFVFGRGSEEVLVLQKEGISYEVVPGITSAVALPELCGIPVTHREAGRSFHVFTGHTNQKEQTLSHIHPEEGTSIFLMGLTHLDEITKKLRDEGKDPETPVAVISRGTMPGQKMVRGTLCDITEKVQKETILPPAIIVVGANAACQMKEEKTGSLAGCSVGVVATGKLKEKLRSHLREKGARLFTLCDMRVTAAEGAELLKKILPKIRQYDWIVFTSQNGVREFFRFVKAEECDIRCFSNIRFAVVGTGTKEALKQEGFHADYMPEQFTTKALAQGLIKQVKKEEKLLLVRARQASEELPAILSQNQISFESCPLYDVVGEMREYGECPELFDAIAFFSASGVDAYLKGKKEEEIRTLMSQDTLICAIGEVTKQRLNAYGLSPDVVPEQYDLTHMIEKLEEKLAERKKDK